MARSQPVVSNQFSGKQEQVTDSFCNGSIQDRQIYEKPILCAIHCGSRQSITETHQKTEPMTLAWVLGGTLEVTTWSTFVPFARFRISWFEACRRVVTVTSLLSMFFPRYCSCWSQCSPGIFWIVRHDWNFYKQPRLFFSGQLYLVFFLWDQTFNCIMLVVVLKEWCPNINFGKFACISQCKGSRMTVLFVLIDDSVMNFPQNATVIHGMSTSGTNCVMLFL